MELDQTLLRAFIAVHESGGFTRAGERLNLTQSAVSHQIKRLEEQVGRPLLHRTTRSLTLTADGLDFLHHAEQILGSFDALTRRFHPSPISGAVRFGAPENFMGERLPALLCQFSRAFPAVRLDVNVNSNLDFPAMIQAKELDLAVVMALPDTVDGRVLCRNELVWVASSSFSMQPGASLPVATFPARCVCRQIGIAALENSDIDWHIILTSQSLPGIRAAVLAGLAVAALRRDDIEPEMKIVNGQFGLPPLPPVDFTLIRNDQDITPAVREFGRLVLNMASPGDQPPV